jgi:hypothetical protein
MTTLPNGNREIAAASKTELWEVTPDYYKSFSAKPTEWAGWEKGQALPPGTTKVWFVAASSSEYLIPDDTLKRDPDWDWSFFAKQGNNLIRLLGQADPPVSILKRLAAESGALNTPNLPRNRGTPKTVLYNGVVRKTKDVVNDFELPPLGDMEVWKIPRNLQWAVGKDFEYDYEKEFNWDTRYLVVTPVAGAIQIYTLQDRIVRLLYDSSRPATAGPTVQALAARERLTINVTLPEPTVGKKRNSQPNSNMHLMLRYVSENPGSTRSDWYVKHLGLSAQGMPGWTSDKSPDGVAASMGWIENKGTAGKYSLHITPTGKLVLARLNAGKSMPYTPKF